MTSDPAHAAAHDDTLSLWAVASPIVSALLCPPFCILGPILGFVGLAQVRRGRTGRRAAYAGIALGVIMTGLWAATMAWWHVNIRRPMLAGPDAALRAGFRGDFDAFRADFHGPGALASDDDVARFVNSLRGLYGDYEGLAPDETSPERIGLSDIDRNRPVIPYLMRFDRIEVSAEAEFVVMDQGRLPIIAKWSRIRILDPAADDLTYPTPAPDAPNHGLGQADH